jgi:hypothetical protein
MSKRNPSISFGYLLSVFSLEQWLQTKDVFFVQNSSVVNISSAVVILWATLVTWVQNKKKFFIFNRTYVLVMILYGYAFLSCFWSPVSDVSLLNYKAAIPYILLTVFIAPLTVINIDKIKKMFFFIVIFGSVLLLILLLYTDWGYRTVILAGNNLNLKTNPLALASFSGYIFIISMFMDNKSKLKYIKWIVAIICLIFAVKTGSRGQFIFMVFSVLVFLPISKHKINIGSFFYMILFCCVLGGISYWVMMNFSGIDIAGSKSRWSGDGLDRDFTNRFAAAQNMLTYWLNSPFTILFGLGSSASFSKDIFGYYVHMVPLEIIGELGLVGFCIYFSILYKVYKSIMRTCFSAKIIQSDRNVLVVFYSLFLFELLLSLKQGSLLGSVLLFSFVIVISRLDYIIQKPLINKKIKYEGEDG